MKIQKKIYAVVFVSLFFGLSIQANEFSISTGNSPIDRTNAENSVPAHSFNLQIENADFYWGQDFVKSAAGYTQRVGKYTVDIAKSTYDKLSKVASKFTNNENFKLLVGVLYDFAKDELADAAIDAALGSLVSSLTGLDAAGTGHALDEVAKSFVGILADELGVKELPDELVAKAYKFVKSYGK